MKDYQRFETEDFVEDPYFRRWIFEKSPEENDFWQHWLLTHSEKRNAVEQAQEILLAVRGEQLPLSELWIDDKVAQLVAKAQVSASSVNRTAAFRLRWQSWIRVAASVALFIGLSSIGYLYYQKRVLSNTTNQPFAIQSQSFIEVSNGSKVAKRVTLPDNSEIILQTKSRVRYPKQFDNAKREVYLVGEAFFQVTKDPSKPFFVYAHELVTKVLGTSFNIRAYEYDQQVVVAVKTGKVSVFAQTDGQASRKKVSPDLTGMILTPNQQAAFSRQEARLARSLVDDPILLTLPQENHNFEFDRTPIAEVFATLEKAYQIHIVFDEELMAHCTLTASLGNEPLFKKLQWICAGTESSYEEIDGQILITGKGCR